MTLKDNDYVCESDVEIRRLAGMLAACHLPIEHGYWRCLFVLQLLRNDAAWYFGGAERQILPPSECSWCRMSAAIMAHMPNDPNQVARVINLMAQELARIFGDHTPSVPSSLFNSSTRSSASSNLTLAWTNPLRSPR